MYWGVGRPAVAIVGSRETPEDILALMRRAGRVLCDQNIGLTSGDADGADIAGYEGYISSPKYLVGMARIYLAKSYVRYRSGRERYADGVTFHDASQFANFEEATAIAYKARGSFHGLNDGGIRLQARNAYQILQDDLKTPVKSIICYAEPYGKKGLVRGGTNTAYQIGREYEIPILNLATEEGLKKLLDYLKRKENPDGNPV